jgi:hypothetical protein
VRFHNYRIPRNNMLMRFAHVSPDGQFKRLGGNELIMYACMLIMR